MISTCEAICRLCAAAPSDNFIELFDESTDPDEGVLTKAGKMMADCIYPELCFEEPNKSGYPTIICEYCNLQLNVFFQFKRKAMDNHRLYTEFIRTKWPKKPDYDDATMVEDENDEIEKIQDFLQSNEEIVIESTDNEKRDFETVDEFTVEDISEEFTEEEQYLDEDDQQIELQSQVVSEFVSVVDGDIEDDLTDDEDYAVEYERVISEEVYESVVIENFDPNNETNSMDSTSVDPIEFKVATTSYLYTCDVCDKSFDCTKKFDRHTKSHQNDEDEVESDSEQKKHRSKAQCDICQKEVYKENIKLHMTSHNHQYRFSCQYCYKGFNTLSQCTAHEARHSNVRPFKCTLCDKSFKLNCDLKTHIMCHNDIRKHECDICHKKFRMASHLKNHIETHNTENTLSCDVCGQLFKTNVTLQNHYRQVHADNHAFKCKICQRGFYRKYRLERHLKTHIKRARSSAKDKVCI